MVAGNFWQTAGGVHTQKNNNQETPKQVFQVCVCLLGFTFVGMIFLRYVPRDAPQSCYGGPQHGSFLRRSVTGKQSKRSTQSTPPQQIQREIYNCSKPDKRRPKGGSLALAV